MIDEYDMIAAMAEMEDDQCSFSGCGERAADSYIVDFQNNKGEMMHFSFPVCSACRESISDIFSEWVPIFCVECSRAGWMMRKGKVCVQDGATAVFSHGCPGCSPSGSKHIWCL